ncbi:hypothetical protein T484DRAFT_1863615, partial [Baffinella frigidus]
MPDIVGLQAEGIFAEEILWESRDIRHGSFRSASKPSPEEPISPSAPDFHKPTSCQVMAPLSLAHDLSSVACEIDEEGETGDREGRLPAHSSWQSGRESGRTPGHSNWEGGREIRVPRSRSQSREGGRVPRSPSWGRVPRSTRSPSLSSVSESSVTEDAPRFDPPQPRRASGSSAGQEAPHREGGREERRQRRTPPPLGGHHDFGGWEGGRPPAHSPSRSAGGMQNKGLPGLPAFVVLNALHAYHSLPPAERVSSVAFAILTTPADLGTVVCAQAVLISGKPAAAGRLAIEAACSDGAALSTLLAAARTFRNEHRVSIAAGRESPKASCASNRSSGTGAALGLGAIELSAQQEITGLPQVPAYVHEGHNVPQNSLKQDLTGLPQ